LSLRTAHITNERRMIMLMEQIEKDELTLDESAKEDNGSLCQELRETIDKFDAMEKTCYEKWVKLEKSRRRCINTAKFTALITAMAATIDQDTPPVTSYILLLFSSMFPPLQIFD